MGLCKPMSIASHRWRFHKLPTVIVSMRSRRPEIRDLIAAGAVDDRSTLRLSVLAAISVSDACDRASPTCCKRAHRSFGRRVLSNDLTAASRELLETFLPLHRFAERWNKRKD